MPKAGTPVLLSLGSNVGNCVSHIRAAIHQLHVEGTVADLVVSRWYHTEPVGYTSQPMFVNVAVAGTTALDTDELVRACKRVEESVGRTHTERWRQREIDVDVILHGNYVVDSNHVCVPHPRMQDRMFVLQPSCDVAASMRHPLLGKTIAELRAECTDAAAVDAFDPETP
jgi:2-amino-4-hydroxy-6-hydroxymethyldihydropteridine diphosphokinase